MCFSGGPVTGCPFFSFLSAEKDTFAEKEADMSRRNGDLVKARNEEMARRYYYLTEVRRMRHDDAMRQLSRQEFYLSESTILAVLRRMARENPGAFSLQEERTSIFQKACARNSRKCG